MTEPTVGPLLREWRRRRHVSQLRLASDADISARHLSFVETGRARPLTAHEPCPAVVVDRQWSLVLGNRAVPRFTAGVAPHLLEPPANVLRLALHPDGMAERIINLGEVRHHLLARLSRQALLTGDPALTTLFAELAGYPGGPPGEAVGDFETFHPADAPTATALRTLLPSS